MKRVTISLVLVLATAAIGRAQSTVYLPQVVAGLSLPTAWATNIVVANGAAPGTAATNGTITFTQDNGSPMNVSSGSLQITTDSATPLVVTTLLFGDNLFGSVPIIPLQ
jgi:hypothetical protein